MPEHTSWSHLTSQQQREFLALITPPDSEECQAWLGPIGPPGVPVWRSQGMSRVATRAKARRILAEALGFQLGQRDVVEMSCDNAGCMSRQHLVVRRLQEISDAERNEALAKLEGRVPRCNSHPDAGFRKKVHRSKATGRVKARYQCMSCERERRRRRTAEGRRFKEANITR